MRRPKSKIAVFPPMMVGGKGNGADFKVSTAYLRSKEIVSQEPIALYADMDAVMRHQINQTLSEVWCKGGRIDYQLDSEHSSPFAREECCDELKIGNDGRWYDSLDE